MNLQNLSNNQIRLMIALLGALILFLNSCSPANYASSQVNKNQHANTTTLDQNNLIVSTESSRGNTGDGSTEIIFKGKNNLLELVANQHTTGQSGKGVIIIQGNGNMIKIDSANLSRARMMRAFNGDTLVLIGNQQRLVLKNGQLSAAPATKIHSTKIQLNVKTIPFSKNRYTPDFQAQLSRKAYFFYYYSKVTIKEALNHFIQQIEVDHNPAGYFELAEMYQHGVGTAINLHKAVELYQLAAVQGHLISITRLADLYHFGAKGFTKNPQLSQYYYSVGSQLGDDYCKSMLGD